MLYLDSAATTETRREVLEAMWPFLTGDFGNPSSTHAVGESAARAVAEARSTLAAWLGCRSSEIVFTSGGTESDNLAIKGSRWHHAEANISSRPGSSTKQSSNPSTTWSESTGSKRPTLSSTNSAVLTFQRFATHSGMTPHWYR